MKNCSTKYEIHAPAKLTLSLAITGVRESGLHELQAEMVTIDFQDTLRLREGDTEVTYQGEYPIAPSSNDDLIVRALNAVGLSMKVEVDKKIPPGGGLGGGSANAAAILRWANFKDEKKRALGSDVPFNIEVEELACRVGESVTYLPYEEKTFTLILPPFSCSTADVYKRWDEMGGPKSPNGNDLEPAALDLYPELQKWKEILEEHSRKEARLAGSGSTWFVEGSYPAEGLIVATTTRENF